MGSGRTDELRSLIGCEQSYGSFAEKFVLAHALRYVSATNEFMDYIKPTDVVTSMIKAGETKAALGTKDLLIRGILSGALLGIATSLAITGAVQTSLPLVGALIFPVGFVIIVLLGLELVTGSFALVPLALKEGKINTSKMLSNLSWVFIGNLIGSVL